MDGQPVPLWRANGLVQGLAVPAGMHRVALRYAPASVGWGTAISALAAFAWLWLIAWRRGAPIAAALAAPAPASV